MGSPLNIDWRSGFADSNPSWFAFYKGISYVNAETA
jgi:hypothetical protein